MSHRCCVFGARILPSVVVALVCLVPRPAISQPHILDTLDLGPLKISALKPGTISILHQQRIIAGSVHRKFRITAESGHFRYAPAGVDVLAGRIHGLSMEGYVHFKSDDIVSMVVEHRDDLKFILSPDTYSLDAYGGGAITLLQKQVWVGNQTSFDLVNREGQITCTGKIYFRTGSVAWKNIQMVTEQPALALRLDATSSNPKRGVLFVFDFATARLELREGEFNATAAPIANDTAAPRTQAAIIDQIDGAIRLVVQNDRIDLSASKLAVAFRAVTRVARDDVPVAGMGKATFTNVASSATLDMARILARAPNMASVHFEPDPTASSRDAAWSLPAMATLLAGAGFSDPADIRKLAIQEARTRLDQLGADLALAIVRRTVLEAFVKEKLAPLPGVTINSVTFGPQSIAVSAALEAKVPFVDVPIRVPLDLEVTLTLNDRALVLRPVARMLMLGRFDLRSPMTVDAGLAAVRDTLVSLLGTNAPGFTEFSLPLDMSPGVNVDLATLANGDLKVASTPHVLSLDLHPVIVMTPDAMWVLSQVGIK